MPAPRARARRRPGRAPARPARPTRRRPDVGAGDGDPPAGRPQQGRRSSRCRSSVVPRAAAETRAGRGRRRPGPAADVGEDREVGGRAGPGARRGRRRRRDRPRPAGRRPARRRRPGTAARSRGRRPAPGTGRRSPAGPAGRRPEPAAARRSGTSSPVSVTVRSTAPRRASACRCWPRPPPATRGCPAAGSRRRSGRGGEPGAAAGHRWARERVSSSSVARARQGRSSRRTMSSPIRAVARQCTLRRSSPWRYSRVLTSSSPCTAIDRRAPSPPPPWPPAGPPAPSGRTRGTTSSGAVPAPTARALHQPERVDQPQPQRAEGVPAAARRRARGSAGGAVCPPAEPLDDEPRRRPELGGQLLRRAATARRCGASALVTSSRTLGGLAARHPGRGDRAPRRSAGTARGPRRPRRAAAARGRRPPAARAPARRAACRAAAGRRPPPTRQRPRSGQARTAPARRAAHGRSAPAGDRDGRRAGRRRPARRCAGRGPRPR